MSDLHERKRDREGLWNLNGRLKMIVLTVRWTLTVYGPVEVLLVQYLGQVRDYYASV